MSWLPPVHVVTWTYVNTHELHYDAGWIALPSCLTQNIDIRHLPVCIFTAKQDRSSQGHHYGGTWPRSSPSLTRGPETDMSRAGIKGPHWWEASILAKSYSNSVSIAMQNIYIWASDNVFFIALASKILSIKMDLRFSPSFQSRTRIILRSSLDIFHFCFDKSDHHGHERKGTRKCTRKVVAP